jgi:hypothetical protein
MWRIGELIVAIVLILLLGLVALFFFHPQISAFIALPWYSYQAQHRRVVILCDTDHQALLKAGREILSKIPKDRLNPQPNGTTLMGSFNVPEGVQIPQAIKDLRSGCVVNYDGYLRMEMHGGMDHFGVLIYPVDFKKPYNSFEYGDKELLPGLWYYDDGYLHNPEYDKRIDELIKKHKKNGNK